MGFSSACLLSLYHCTIIVILFGQIVNRLSLNKKKKMLQYKLKASKGEEKSCCSFDFSAAAIRYSKET